MGDHDSLGQQLVLDGSQRVVDPDEVPLAVLFQDQGVEVQADPVARLGPQQPLQFHVGRVGGAWEARRLDHALLADVDVEGLLHCGQEIKKKTQIKKSTRSRPEGRAVRFLPRAESLVIRGSTAVDTKRQKNKKQKTAG